MQAGVFEQKVGGLDAYLDLGGQPGVQFGDDVVGRRLTAVAEFDGLRKGGVFLAQFVQARASLADGFVNIRLSNQGLVDDGVNWVHMSASV